MLHFLNISIPLVTKYRGEQQHSFLNASLVSMDVILEVEVLLNEDSKPAGRDEAQNDHRHDHGSLNSRRDHCPLGDSKEPDDSDRGNLEGNVECLHGLQRSAAARALHDMRPVPVHSKQINELSGV